MHGLLAGLRRMYSSFMQWKMYSSHAFCIRARFSHDLGTPGEERFHFERSGSAEPAWLAPGMSMHDDTLAGPYICTRTINRIKAPLAFFIVARHVCLVSAAEHGPFESQLVAEG